MSYFRDVLKFHQVLHPERIGDATNPGIPEGYIDSLGMRLINEEYDELVDAIRSGDLVEAVDGTIDLIYVLLGALVSWGVDGDPLWQEVHSTNMDKVRGPVREDGKRLKPADWKPPRIRELLAYQASVNQSYRYAQEITKSHGTPSGRPAERSDQTAEHPAPREA